MNFVSEETIKKISNFLLDKEYVYITTITEEYLDMTYNWFLSLKRCEQGKYVIVSTTDEKTKIKLEELGIFSILIDIKIDSNKTKSEWIENEKRIKFLIPFFICDTFKKNIIHSDVDIFFNKNPYPVLEKYKNEGYDLVLMSDRRFDPFIPKRKIGVQSLISQDKKSIDYGGPTAQQLYGEENAGFSFININDNNHSKLKECFKVFNNPDYFKSFETGTEAGNLQTITNKRIKDFNLKIKKLNCYDFVNGSIWKIPYMNKEIKNSCYMVHYNFCEPFDLEPISLKHKKIEWMKQNNHWLI